MHTGAHGIREGATENFHLMFSAEIGTPLETFTSRVRFCNDNIVVKPSIHRFLTGTPRARADMSVVRPIDVIA